MRILLRKMKVQRDSLVTATAALVEAVRTSDGGLWEAPKGLRREDLAAWLGGQKAQVREFKESIKRQRVGLVPRGDTQRKQDGRQEKPKQQEPVWTESPARRQEAEELEKIQREQQTEVKIKKTFFGRRKEPTIKEERDRSREKSPGVDCRVDGYGHR